MDVNCSTDRRTSLAPRSPENESGRRATEREDSGHDEVIVAARARGGSRPRASPPQFLDPALRTLSMKSPIRVLLPASVFLFSGWILACEGHAPSTPEGWQTLTNVTGKCQLAIPPDWTAQTAGPPGGQPHLEAPLRRATRLHRLRLRPQRDAAHASRPS